MSAEHLHSPESTPEISRAEHEQKLEQLRNKIEQEGREDNAATNAEQARQAIERQPEPDSKAAESESKRQANHPTRLDKQAAFNDTMRSLQRRLKPTQKAFSRIIHTPAVEKASDLAAQTIFRPSVTLGATITALIVGGGAYLAARYYGFALSGSEFLLSLAAGGFIGLLIELIGKTTRRR